MADKSKTYERIVAVATDLFLRYGYSRVVIDEIAKELSMSKKTIYNHFANKSAILLACIDAYAEQYRQETNTILNDVDLSLRQKINKLMQHTGTVFSTVTQEFKQDIKRNEPEAWAKYNAYLRDISLLHLRQLLEEGTRVGYLRTNADSNLGILVYVAAVQQFHDPDFLTDFPYDKELSIDGPPLLDKVIEIIFHGLLSPKFNE